MSSFFSCSSVKLWVMLQLKPIKIANFSPLLSILIDAMHM
jgi:hypothetical protein